MGHGVMASLAKLAICAAASYLAYWVYWEVKKGRPRRQIIKQNGCKPVKLLPSLDPFFGLDTLLGLLRWHKEHRSLSEQQQLFVRLNTKTVGIKILHERIILSIEPENLKTVLSLKFNSWGIGGSRRRIAKVLGEGIFCNDGLLWKHSREMLRPIFVRSQLNDLSMIERHVQNLIQAIPRDGSTIDLGTLFPRLTFDVATEVLFGESTNDLAPDSRRDNVDFIAAFDRCMNVLGGNTSRGIFGLFLPDYSFRRDCKFIHSQSTLQFDRSLADPWTTPLRYVLLDLTLLRFR